MNTMIAALIVIGCAAIAFMTIYLIGVRQGKAIARAQFEENKNKAALEAKEIRDEVDNYGSNDLDTEYNKWLR